MGRRAACGGNPGPTLRRLTGPHTASRRRPAGKQEDAHARYVGCWPPRAGCWRAPPPPRNRAARRDASVDRGHRNPARPTTGRKPGGRQRRRARRRPAAEAAARRWPCGLPRAPRADRARSATPRHGGPGWRARSHRSAAPSPDHADARDRGDGALFGSQIHPAPPCVADASSDITRNRHRNILIFPYNFCIRPGSRARGFGKTRIGCGGNIAARGWPGARSRATPRTLWAARAASWSLCGPKPGFRAIGSKQR